jgi:TolB protein
VVRADGTGLVNVTADPANGKALSWAPDGSLLAFSSDRAGTDEIYLVKPDGSGLRRLTDTPSGGSWLNSSGAFRPLR